MHVLYILGQDAGGLPHYTAELANAVAEHAEVTVFKPIETTADDVFSSDIDVREPFEPLGISMPKIYRREVDPRVAARGIFSYRNLRQIRDLDVDVVHDTTDLFPQVKLFLKWSGIDDRFPVVITRHEVEQKRFSFTRPPHLVEEVFDYLIPDVTLQKTIVHTKNQKQALVERGVSPAAVAVIPHGAYTLFGDYDDLERDPEPNTLLFFGNVVRHKGIDTLIRAIPILAQSIEDVKLLVAGDGQIPSDVAHIVDDNPAHFELHNRFIPNDDVKRYFERAQVVVMPYHEREGGTNGHSGALATALSFGKPVVTSKAGEFPELVEESGAGRTVPSGDPEALAMTLNSLLQDESTRREMAANSRRQAEALTWESIAEKHIQLYSNAI
ncbi:glycosyltransferase family 4 protein [Haloarchaeobius sp. DFWS5]|uniref:glycosyltransferase family 4 protein n=1 Tax=Haloarchaeobius sp. DFWS5 TaxID=3446114 RepID=UPI003EBB3112